MLADPQTLTLQGVSQSLARVQPFPVNGSRYAYTIDGTQYDLLVSRSIGARRNRVDVKLIQKQFTDDPLADGTYVPVSATFGFYIDSPNSGYTGETLAVLAGDLVNYLDTAGLMTKLVNGET